MRFTLMVAVALVGACAPKAPPAGLAPTGEAPRVIHVDAEALPGGDGSAAHPFRRLADGMRDVADGGRVELASGIYEGGVELGPAVTLAGTSDAVVVHAEDGTAITINGGKLERVAVQGGSVGVRAAGDARLVDVRFSGQRGVALDVAGGKVVGERLSLEASVSEKTGISVAQGAALALTGSNFKGPWGRGIDSRGDVVVESSTFEDAVIGVHAREGSARLSGVKISDGRGPAILVNEASVTLRKVAVRGHEYGLLGGAGARVDVEDLYSEKAELAGIGLSGAEARLMRIAIVDAGRYGGVQLTGSRVQLDVFKIIRALAGGVVVRSGNVLIARGSISGTRADDPSSGDGVLVRAGEVKISNVKIEQSAGAGVLIGNAAHATIERVEILGATAGGLVADTNGEIDATTVTIEGARSAAVVALEGSRVTIDGLEIRASEADIWAECASNSHVTVQDLVLPGQDRTLAPCIEVH